MSKQPLFVSLVGESTGADDLYDRLERDLEDRFPDLNIAFLGDPFSEYGSLQIGERPKSTFPPQARALMRLALFYTFNAEIAKPTFERDTDIVIVRRFGFDLYCGSVAYSDCDEALGIHESLLPFTVRKLGLCPPLYIFSEPSDECEQKRRDKYFEPRKGQRYARLNPAASLDAKVQLIFDILEKELEVADNMEPA